MKGSAIKQAVEKVRTRMTMSKKRTLPSAILNRSCAAGSLLESMLLTDTPQSPFSTVC
jgi:hypothetical protein